MTTELYKKCANCGEVKSAPEFVIRKKAKDGLYSYCKACSNSLIKAYAYANPDKIKEKGRRHRSENPETTAEKYRKWREVGRRWEEENPDKAKARKVVGKAVRAGKIARVGTLTCKLCSLPAHEYHHDDYGKPLDVVPLCRSCHRTITSNGKRVTP